MGKKYHRGMVEKRDTPEARLGRHISVLRKKRGITLERLAYEVGISKGNLSDIENGNRDPRYSSLRAIAHGLGITISELVKGF